MLRGIGAINLFPSKIKFSSLFKFPVGVDSVIVNVNVNVNVNECEEEERRGG